MSVICKKKPVEGSLCYNSVEEKEAKTLCRHAVVRASAL